MKNVFVFHIFPFIKLLLLVLTYPFWMFLIPYKRRRFLAFSRMGWNALPVISLDQIVPENMNDDMSVSIKALRAEEHNCSVVELYVLGLCARVVGACNTYEIGTYDGRSTLAIACNIKKPGKVYTLNLPKDYLENNPEKQESADAQLSKKVLSGYRFLRQPEKERITQWWGNSLEFSAETNAPYDLIFIDGGHSYTAVKHDSLEALRLINKENGVIIWHDATNFGVGRLLPELTKKGNHLYRIKGTDMAIMQFRGGKNLSYLNTM